MKNQHNDPRETPEGRLAAVVQSLKAKISRHFPNQIYGPDFRDYMEALKLPIRREILMETLLALGSTKSRGDQIREGITEMIELDKQIAKRDAK
jgi:hypothetical protein